MQCKTQKHFDKYLNFSFSQVVLYYLKDAKPVSCSHKKLFFCHILVSFCPDKTVFFRLIEQSGLIQSNCKVIILFEKAQMEESHKVVISIIIQH